MAITNHERVGKALDLLKAGLGPFADREVKGALESRRLDAFKLRDDAEDALRRPAGATTYLYQRLDRRVQARHACGLPRWQ